MPLPLFLPCAAGVEQWLAEEVTRCLPASAVRVQRGGVALQGEALEVMTLNLESRLAQRVLMEVAHAPYLHEQELYDLARQVDWTEWITPDQTIRVDVTAHRSPLKSLNFAALRVKDAVCDAMREATGDRPNVDTRHADLSLVLHLGPDHASLYIDASGEPLFKRGWREDKGDAPLKETLAAALLAAAGWQGEPDAGGALHDPCCGSGTIVIEAAQMACRIAPGLRRRFAFERLIPFQSTECKTQWQQLKAQAKGRIRPSPVPIYGSDVSFRMVDFAHRNAERAGVEQAITFNGGDALERPAPALPFDLCGTLIINPPYGERIDVTGKAGTGLANESHLGPNKSLSDDFFSRLATHWKRAYTGHPAGWTAYVLSPDMKLPTAMRFKESQRIPMWNGRIECRLYRFELVSGSLRS